LDPPKRAELLREVVCRGKKRKYYRFRYSRHYGGIATADCVGCNLDCAFCWVNQPRKKPHLIGRFYSPEEVVERLMKISREKGIKRVRLSGGEPTLCKEHLLSLLSLIEEDIMFILETNGTLIDEKLAEELSRFSNLHVRVSIKACTPQKFKEVTNSTEDGFRMQIKAIENLFREKVSFHVSLVTHFCSEEEVISLIHNLRRTFGVEVELERLELYEHVLREISKRGLKLINPLGL